MGSLLLCRMLFFMVLATAFPNAWAANPLPVRIEKNPEPPTEQTVVPDLTDKEVDERRVKLEVQIAERRKQYSPDALAALRHTYREVANHEEFDEWVRLNHALATLLEEQGTTLLNYLNYRKATHDKIELMTSWKGFEEKPPYSIFMVDDLHDALTSKQNVLKSLDVIRATIKAEFEEYSNSIKNSSKRVRLAEEDLETNTGKPGELRSRWLLQLAQLQHEVNQTGVVYGEVRRLAVAELQKGVQAEVDFLNRKIATAQGNYRFTEDELKQKVQAIDDQLKRVRQKKEQAKDYEKDARRQLDAATAAVKKAQAVSAAGGKPKTPVEQLLREETRRQLYLDDSIMRVLVTSGMVQLLVSEKSIWEERYRIANRLASNDAQAKLASKRNELDLVAKWKEYINSKLGVIEHQIGQQEALASVAITPGFRDEINSDLALYQEQKSLLQRGILFINEYEQLVQRRNAEVLRAQERIPLSGRARSALSTVASQVGRVWNAELYVAEETIIAEGRKIVRPRSITVGKVVEALLILFVGIWLLRCLKRPIHWFATHRLQMGANDAQLYTRLLTYLLFIGVLFSALIFVNIPLAVFTFLGGALAIGVGFGAQTLINNFISGLILMFDRTIRMGDMVEVDGHRGRVAAIGMRSSSIKRFDGVEMLVPNSHFLQQNVINWTSSDQRARYAVSVGVAYGSPTREVERIIRTAVEEQPEVLTDPAPYVVFEDFAESSLLFTAYFWVELDPEVNTMIVFSDIRHRIGEQLAAAGIVIPFPQRDLHLPGGQAIEVRIAP